MLILGIDDAGRGPIIGPMILAGVLVRKDQEESYKKKGVEDSKAVIHSKRVELAKYIKETAISYHIVKSSPELIDHAIISGMNLNTLEAMKTAEIINALNPKKEKIKAIVDCPSVNIPAWTAKVREFVKHIDNLDLVCEHKADVNHPSVSAASILAKCAREEEVAKIKKQYGNIGSGYPSDPTTKEFLAKQGRALKDSGIFRKSWATWKSLFPGNNQSTLEGF